MRRYLLSICVTGKDFVNKIDEAYAKDMEAISRGENALSRISMLKEIEKRLTDVDFARWYPAAAQPNSQLPRQQFYDRNSGVAPAWPLGQSASQHSRLFSRR